MRRSAFILPAVLLILIGIAAYKLQDSPDTVDSAIQPYLKGEMAKLSILDGQEVLSDHSILQEDGTSIILSSFQGKVLLVNLWASWCAPCRKEMPELSHLQKLLGDDGFEVVAISVDRGGIEQARETLEEWGIEGLNLYSDPTMKIAMDLAKGALPMSLIVDRSGAVRAQFLGPLKWDSEEALRLFAALKAGDI